MTSKSAPKASFYLGFLLLLSIFNFAHRQMPISLGPQIMDGLGIDYAQLGILIGYAFIVLYSVAGMVLGTMADRWNRPRLIAIGLALWSAATLLSGFTESFAQIVFLRMLVGVGAAVLTPTALGMSLIVSAFLEAAEGWRSCFHVVGLASLVFVPVVLLLKDPPRGAMEATPSQSSSGDENAKRSTMDVVRELLGTVGRSPALAATIVGSVIIVWPISAAAMSVTWLENERFFIPWNAKLYSGVIFMIAGFIGNVGGGWVSDLFHRRWSGGRLWYMACAQLVLGGPALAWYLLPADSRWFYVAWFVGSIAATSYFGAMFATVQDLVPAGVRSSMVGLLLLIINIFASGMAPWVAGMIGDAFSLTRGLVICACVGFLSIPVFAFAARHYAADVARLGE
jgi:MFS family permease